MRRPRNLSPEERHLWQHVAHGVTPLHAQKEWEREKENLFPAKTTMGPPKKQIPASHHKTPPHVPKPARAATHNQTVNGTVARRLRKGRAQIDGRLDLHGMRQAEAHDALTSFIFRARDHGKRCVLIITGKGSKGAGHSNPYETPGPGVLRTRLRQWIAQEPLRRFCYGIEEAHPRHGGSGAFYVFIRKNG